MVDIKYYRQLKYVNRMARWPLLRPYNVLEHSYMVTVLFRHFAERENLLIDWRTMEIIMNHDILEAVTGDLPYDVKNMTMRTHDAWDTIEQEVVHDFPQLKPYTDAKIKERLTEYQFNLFKTVDMLELWIFLKEEQELGNNHPEINSIVAKAERIIRGKFKSIDDFMLKYRLPGHG